MTLETVAVDDPVLASTMQQVIAHVNGSPGRAVYTSNGTWSVPNGVHKFKVTLCGGGGRAGAATSSGGGEDSSLVPGPNGGTAPMISAIFAGVELGTTFAITIGAGGTSGAGGTTSFGTLMSSGGGGAGGGTGTATFPAGAPSVYHTNELFCVGPASVGFGRGGNDGDGGPGYPGVVVVEW